MGSPRIPLEPGGVYHICNHAVGSDIIFREDENFYFFLKKFSGRIASFADVLSYCLMPNHFHFVIRIKNDLEMLWHGKANKKKLKHAEFYDQIITTQFANLFNSYVHAFNRKYFRQGTLLKESFQRKRITTNEYLITVTAISVIIRSIMSL
jgi:putative transposase